MVKGFATIDNVALINVEGTGMVGVPGTASTIFATVRDANVNVIMISQVPFLTSAFAHLQSPGALLSCQSPFPSA
jgi:aspartokinase